MMPEIKPFEAHFKDFTSEDKEVVIKMINDYTIGFNNLLKNSANDPKLLNDYKDPEDLRRFLSFDAANRIAEKYNCKIDPYEVEQVVFLKP